MRRRLAILLGSTMLLLSLGMSVPAATVAESATCTLNLFREPAHAGAKRGSSLGADANGVRAKFWIPGENHFRTCDPFHEGNDASSVWLSIEPASGSGGHNGGAILQYGVTTCNDVTQIGNPDPPCNYGNDPRYFYAAAGCGNYLPVGFDLGPIANKTWANLQISYDYSTDLWDLKDLNRQPGNQTVGSIDPNNPVVSCWLDRPNTGGFADLYAGWFGETWDPGDSLGTLDCGSWPCPTLEKRLVIDDAEWRNHQGGTWQHPGFNIGSGCELNTRATGGGRIACDTAQGFTMLLWSPR